MNFGVSDIALGATIEKMEGGKMSQNFLISSEPLYINHFNSLFDEIWNNGIDAKARIKAIEEGVDSEGIEIIQDPVEIQKLGFSLMQQATKEILVMYSTANAFHRQERGGAVQLLMEAATKRGVKVRILTPEDELLLEATRKLLITQDEAQQPHQNMDIRYIHVIQNPVEIQKLGFSLMQQATKEILVMYSTANAFHRQERGGAVQLLMEAATKRGVKVRILTPEDELLLEATRKLLITQDEAQQPHQNMDIRYIQPHLQTKATIIIVDKKYSLTIELKDDTKQTSIEAIGLATYSNSQSTVLSYASIFESLWTQTDLYQKLRESEKVKDDFVNIAAHQLRTPIQPILGLADILRSKETDGGEKAEYLDVTIRNEKGFKDLLKTS